MDNLQKIRWTKVAIYSNFEDADKKRNELNEDGKQTKIRRCGAGGSRYKVLTGESIDKKPEASSKGEKPKTRASRRAARERRKKSQNS